MVFIDGGNAEVPGIVVAMYIDERDRIGSGIKSIGRIVKPDFQRSGNSQEIIRGRKGGTVSADNGSRRVGAFHRSIFLAGGNTPDKKY
jgi:hypothetical protein